MTFAQHLALAQAWLRATERRGTDRQAFALMRLKTAQELREMLMAAEISLPLGCSPQEPLTDVGHVRILGKAGTGKSAP